MIAPRTTLRIRAIIEALGKTIFTSTNVIQAINAVYALSSPPHQQKAHCTFDNANQSCSLIEPTQQDSISSTINQLYQTPGGIALTIASLLLSSGCAYSHYKQWYAHAGPQKNRSVTTENTWILIGNFSAWACSISCGIQTINFGGLIAHLINDLIEHNPYENIITIALFTFTLGIALNTFKAPKALAESYNNPKCNGKSLTSPLLSHVGEKKNGDLEASTANHNKKNWGRRAGDSLTLYSTSASHEESTVEHQRLQPACDCCNHH